MKRLLAVALVGVLLVTAGCSMTSPAADQAREAQQTTTQSSQSAPEDTAPIQVELPAGYSPTGIDNVSAAYESHRSALQTAGYQAQYEVNQTGSTTMTVVNGSGPDRIWNMTVIAPDGERTVHYQDGDRRYSKAVHRNGTTETSVAEPGYTSPDELVGNESVRWLLEHMNVSSQQVMQDGNTTYIFYRVTTLGDRSVSQGHLIVLPSGQIKFLVIQLSDGNVIYSSTTGEGNPVTEPDFVANATAES